MTAALTPTAVIQPMTADEARQCVMVLRQRLQDAREAAFALYSRRGFEALGYVSFAACCQVELGASWQHAYRLIHAEEVTHNVLAALPDMDGEMAGSITIPVPVTYAQVVKHLPPERQVTALVAAHDMARQEGERVTVNHVKAAARQEEARQHVLLSRYAVIGHLVATGDITAKAGSEMVEKIDALRPVIRGQVMELIARYGLSAPALIPHLGNLLERQLKGDRSRVLSEMLATGCLGGRPLATAGLADWARANAEAQAEHVADAVERERMTRGWTAEVVTLRKGDPRYSAKALLRMLGTDEFTALIEAMQQLADAQGARA